MYGSFPRTDPWLTLTIQRHLIYTILPAKNRGENGYFSLYNYEGMHKMFVLYLFICMCLDNENP